MNLLAIGWSDVYTLSNFSTRDNKSGKGCSQCFFMGTGPRVAKANENTGKVAHMAFTPSRDPNQCPLLAVSADHRNAFANEFARLTITAAATTSVLQSALATAAEDTLTTTPTHAKRPRFCTEVEAATKHHDLEQLRCDQRHRGATTRLALAKVNRQSCA